MNKLEIVTDRAGGLGASQLSGFNLFRSIHSADEKTYLIPVLLILLFLYLSALMFIFHSFHQLFFYEGLKLQVIIIIESSVCYCICVLLNTHSIEFMVTSLNVVTCKEQTVNNAYLCADPGFICPYSSYAFLNGLSMCILIQGSKP